MSIPYRERVTSTIAEFEQATGLGNTKTKELIRAGAIQTTKVGRRRLIVVKSVLKLLEGASGVGEARVT